EVKESAGAALLPVLDKLGGMLGAVAKFAQDNQGAMTARVIVVGLLAAAGMVMNGVMAVVRTATLAWTAVQWALNSAFLANPLTWIVIIIVALVAAIVIAYKKSQT